MTEQRLMEIEDAIVNILKLEKSTREEIREAINIINIILSNNNMEVVVEENKEMMIRRIQLWTA